MALIGFCLRVLFVRDTAAPILSSSARAGPGVLAGAWPRAGSGFWMMAMLVGGLLMLIVALFGGMDAGGGLEQASQDTLGDDFGVLWMPPALCTGGLLLIFAALLLGFFHPLVVIPTMIQSLGCLALAFVLALAQSYASAVEDILVRTQGDLMLTRKGRDFSEYPKLRAQLEAMPCVRAAVPMLVVSGLAYPAGGHLENAPPPMAKAFVLRGIAATDYAKSRVLSALQSATESSLQDLSAPEPAERDRDFSQGPKAADRQRPPEIWMGFELARSLGLQRGQEVILSVRARHAIRDAQGLRYEFSTRERRFVLRRRLDLGDLELNSQLAFVSLSAAQALAHGQPWVSAIDLELCEEARPKLLEFAASLQQRLVPAGLYSVFSWRHSPERLEQLRSFRSAAAVITLGLFVACALSVALASMVLLRLRRRFFWTLWALGSSPRQMRHLSGVVVAVPILAGMLLGLLLFWIATQGPAIALPLGLARPVELRFSLAGADVGVIAAMTLLSLAVAFPMVRSELRRVGERK